MAKNSSKASDTKEVKTSMEPKRLMRSKRDRVIGGVCGGLGEYFNIDSTLIRLLFVVIALTGGSGFLIYLVLWVVLPEAGDEGKKSEEVMKENGKEIEDRVKVIAHDVEDFAKERNTKIWLGIAVILLGLYFTFGSFGLSKFFDLGWYLARLWPLFIIILGVLILVKNSDGKK